MHEYSSEANIMDPITGVCAAGSDIFTISDLVAIGAANVSVSRVYAGYLQRPFIS